VARGKCSTCGRPAVTLVRYSGAHLCKAHFTDFIEGKVGREFRRQVRLGDRAIVAVALSGGKDSVVALRILHGLLSPRRGTRMVAITVDEGVGGYRPAAIKIAARNCKQIGVEHRIVSFKEQFGVTMDSSKGAWGTKTPCTYCGVLRRHCLNMEARRSGADFLATGLNLDDTAQSILMNICRGDVARLARLGPHGQKRAQDGLVPRIQPLRQLTDKETFLYATLKGFPVHHSVCPYAGDAMRNRFRDIVQGLEMASPGTRFCILNSYDGIRKWLEPHYPPAGLLACVSCGEPSMDGLCEACKLVKLLKRQSGAGSRESGREVGSRQSGDDG